ncbi:MFS transporter [Nakamurella sp. YIM 132084]|uniref:MFS transporter n=1 Tax=Nakamurella leprariae TaxID=2803911 RepID=A0A938YED8_9ACTN|nr:MFS transporter [Nakamurella leprariae]
MVLLLCCSSVLLVLLDVTVVTVALPSIGTDLAADVSDLQWTVDAYTLVVAALLLAAGATADRIGRRRVFRTGLVVFALGSLLCSLAWDVGSLLAFRMVQAVGGSMLVPVALSIVTTTFPEPRERARALGLWGATFGVSLALGPPVGGLLTHAVDWRAVFWVNVPIALLVAVVAGGVAGARNERRAGSDHGRHPIVPESRAPRPRRIDVPGQLLLAVGVAGLVAALIEGPDLGWSSPVTLALLGVAVLALASLVPVELHRREPVLDPRFFRSVPFSSAIVAAVGAFAAFGAFLLVGSLLLQAARGLTPAQAGLCLLPTAATVCLGAPLSGRLLAQGRGTRSPLLLAGTSTAAGGLLLWWCSGPDVPLWPLLVAFALVGLGFGMVNAPITTTAVSGMPAAQAGAAAGLAATGRQVGTALGVAVAGSLTGTTGRDVAAVGAGFADAAGPVWLTLVGLGLLIGAAALLSTTARARRSAGSVRSLLDGPDAHPAGA